MREIPKWLIEFLNDIDKDEAKIVIENLKNDGVISSATWKNFCKDLKDEIDKKRPSSPEEKKGIFNEVCSRYCLEGSNARIPPEVKILNRAVSAKVFVDECLVQNRYPSTEPGETPSLDDFLLMELSDQQNLLTNYPLSISGKCVWVFFPEPKRDLEDPDPIDDPRVQARADRLRKVLGLQCSGAEGENLVCLRYPVKSAKRKKVPLTISAGFNPCFRPSDDPNAPFGWTYDIESRAKGFPEVVHENLSAEHISFKVRYVSSARND